MARVLGIYLFGAFSMLGLFMTVQDGHLPNFKDEIKECEKHLPRNEHCEIQWKAVPVDLEGESQ